MHLTGPYTKKKGGRYARLGWDTTPIPFGQLVLQLRILCTNNRCTFREVGPKMHDSDGTFFVVFILLGETRTQRLNRLLSMLVQSVLSDVNQAMGQRRTSPMCILSL